MIKAPKFGYIHVMMISDVYIGLVSGVGDIEQVIHTLVVELGRE